MTKQDVTSWITDLWRKDLAHWISVLIPVMLAAAGVYASTMKEFQSEIEQAKIEIARQEILLQQAADDIKYVRQRIDELYNQWR